MVHLTSFLNLTFWFVLIAIVRQSEAACRQLGMECSKRPEKNAGCCSGYTCNDNEQCDFASSLNNHDKYCIRNQTEFCPQPGSAPGFCDCCPKFNPPIYCYYLTGLITDLIEANNTEELKNPKDQRVDYYINTCQGLISVAEAECNSCGERCVRTYPFKIPPELPRTRDVFENSRRSRIKSWRRTGS
ncbi:hypothetical protein BY458DRAFT_559315 [Sporodiniella umbellata]|nr:hypothetical protein BY458DRAFT_559315 [Sporodiniella umbellata]